MKCYCCSDVEYDKCCRLIIEGKRFPISPEELMRSRYSAYCTLDFKYVVNTYAAAQRDDLTVEDIQHSAEGTRWTALIVLSNEHTDAFGQVQFKAFYRIGSDFYVLHELSDFVKEDNQWRYLSGTIQDDSGKLTVQRNTPCPCLSQLKFKRCCGK